MNIPVKKASKWIIRFIGPLILVMLVVTINVDLHKFQILLLSTRVEFFMIALFLISPLSALTRAWRWNMLLHVYGINYKFWEAFKLYYIGLFISCFIPQGLGTFSKTVYLRADGYPLDRSTVSILVDKGLNFVAMASVVLASFLYLFFTFTTGWQALLLCLLLAILLILVLRLTDRFGGKVPHLLIWPFERLGKWSKSDISWVHRDFRELTRNQIIMLVLVSIVATSFDYLAYYLLILALRLDIPFLYFVVLSSVAVIIQHIPVSFNGIGTRETTLVLVFAILGKSKEAALALSALILLMSLASNLLGGIAWMMRPLKLTPGPSQEIIRSG